MGIYIKGWDIYPADVLRCGAVFDAQSVNLPNCITNVPSVTEADGRAQSALGGYAGTSSRFRPKGG